ncbi:alpha/beta fold hydrolase [Arcanobacterium ihumii]|uniref:hypothetical protein n=1 Tax=Arcanobacterium ihumii TaxID=2138162 RepID=UPI000F5230E1|nr:hypothetical protein [Arcanobacterium ihumii]
MKSQKRVAQGLSIKKPILALTSARHMTAATWSDEMLEVDTVLDIENTWPLIENLGSDVTLVKIDKAVHDVVFSRKSAREEAYRVIAAWIDEHLSR